MCPAHIDVSECSSTPGKEGRTHDELRKLPLDPQSLLPLRLRHWSRSSRSSSERASPLTSLWRLLQRHPRVLLSSDEVRLFVRRERHRQRLDKVGRRTRANHHRSFLPPLLATRRRGRLDDRRRDEDAARGSLLHVLDVRVGDGSEDRGFSGDEA